MWEKTPKIPGFLLVSELTNVISFPSCHGTIGHNNCLNVAIGGGYIKWLAILKHKKKIHLSNRVANKWYTSLQLARLWRFILDNFNLNFGIIFGFFCFSRVILQWFSCMYAVVLIMSSVNVYNRYNYLQLTNNVHHHHHHHGVRESSLFIVFFHLVVVAILENPNPVRKITRGKSTCVLPIYLVFVVKVNYFLSSW